VVVLIFNYFDWICCNGTKVVCMYVCVYVCLCVEALQPKRMNGFWLNFLLRILQMFARSVFLGFWNFKINNVMAAILHFFSGALSWLQFCSDFLQNCRQGRKLSSAVCFRKSARSVGNFRKYGGPRLRKNQNGHQK